MKNFLNKSDEKVILILRCRSCDITEVIPIQFLPRSRNGDFIEMKTYLCPRCWGQAEVCFDKRVILIRKERVKEQGST